MAKLTQDDKKAWAKAKADELMGMIDGFIDRLVQATSEADFAATMREYLDTARKFWSYSYNNQLLIAIQAAQYGFESTYVKGQKGWTTDFNRRLKKDEWLRPLLIQAPVFGKVTDPDTGQEREKLLYFKTVKVFDVSQTEVIPGLDDLFKPGGFSWLDLHHDNAPLLLQLLLTAARDAKLTVLYEDLRAGNLGCSRNDLVTIVLSTPTHNPCMADEARQSATLLHEMAHALGHGEAERKGYWSQETGVRKQLECQAEAVSYIVGGILGLDNVNTPSYLALYGADADTIKQNIAAIRTIAKKITDLVQDAEKRLNAQTSGKEAA